MKTVDGRSTIVGRTEDGARYSVKFGAGTVFETHVY